MLIAETRMGDQMETDVIPFLKAFLFQVLAERQGKDPLDKGVLAESERLFHLMVDDSVSFCNDDTNPRMAELLESIDH